MIFPFRLEPFSISVGATLGIILQTLIQHHLARRRNKEDRRDKEIAEAKNRFREAVLAELSIILLDRKYWPGGIDGFPLQAVPKLQTAVQAYRAYVRAKDLAPFDKAWENFVCFCNERTPDSNYAAAKMYPSMPGQDPAEFLREHINRILSFAKN
ncbi:MAG: hypothetical protein ABSG91_07025 [Syntrophobacteraceae bacterium]|jgi:hypothetical protein